MVRLVAKNPEVLGQRKIWSFCLEGPYTLPLWGYVPKDHPDNGLRGPDSIIVVYMDPLGIALVEMWEFRIRCLGFRSLGGLWARLPANQTELGGLSVLLRTTTSAALNRLNRA